MKYKVYTVLSEIKSMSKGKDTITVTGMASTSDVDRVGDVIVPDAWTKGGLDNYTKNPIILFNHNYNNPIGKGTEFKVTDKGLEITAEISKADPRVATLVEQGILKTFSVGFRVKDADYMEETGGLKITDAELIEVSIVSIPANQSAVFEVVKSYNSQEFDEFKKGLTVPTLPDTGNKEALPSSKENKTMDKEEMKKFLEEISKNAATAATAAAKMAVAEEAAARKKAEEDEAARKALEAANLEVAVKAGASGAEKLLEEVKKTFADKSAATDEKIASLEVDLRDRSKDLAALRESKRTFVSSESGVDWKKAYGPDLVNAYILNAVLTGKGGFEGTKFGKEILEKATNAMSSAAAPTATSIEIYENTVSTSIERDIQNLLVLAPLFREIQMKTATMAMPILPDAGYAEFVSTKTYTNTGKDAPEGSLSERGDTVGSPYGGVDLTNKTLSVKKLLSISYLANETEEDTILAILPLINETMIRSHARSVEHSMLLGGHTQGVLTGSFDGICEQARDNSKETQSVIAQATDKLTAANLMTLRRGMGKWGVRPTDVVYIVSQTGYFDLLEDPEFQDMNLVGSNAIKLTGEIGNVYGSKVMLCDEFPAPAVSKLFAAALNPRNFIVPRMRGVTLESAYYPGLQHRELVASQRLGMDSIITAGTSCVTYKYKAS